MMWVIVVVMNHAVLREELIDLLPKVVKKAVVLKRRVLM